MWTVVGSSDQSLESGRRLLCKIDYCKLICHVCRTRSPQIRDKWRWNMEGWRGPVIFCSNVTGSWIVLHSQSPELSWSLYFYDLISSYVVLGSNCSIIIVFYTENNNKNPATAQLESSPTFKPSHKDISSKLKTKFELSQAIKPPKN